MALIKRFGVYVTIAFLFLYTLYSLSFPYEPENTAKPDNDQKKGGNEQKKDNSPPKAPAPAPAPSPPKSYNWANVPIKHPVESLTPLPTGEPKALPKIQYAFTKEDLTAKNIRETRQAEVKKAFETCWRNYRQKAWMHDELRPITGGSADTFGGWAATLIDALDTLWIMGFKEEFDSAMKDVEQINFGSTQMETVNVFETNIRHLGGLLSAYELSGHDTLLKKAKEVGEMLYRAFDTPNHMPISRWDHRKAGEGQNQVAHENMLIAELGSMSMEFTRLSQITGNPKWYDAITRITRALENSQSKTKLPGMWPVVVNARELDFTQDNSFTLGAMADSTYEYLAKTYALLGGRESVYQKLYENSMETAIKHTLYRPMTPENADLLMAGFVRVEDSGPVLEPKLEHLVCFTGGMFALGGKLFELPEHVKIGRQLASTCVWAYKASPAGIMPEVSHLYKCANATTCEWDEKAWKDAVAAKASLSKEKDPLQNIASMRLPEGFTAIDDRSYILRPEAIESVFLMYRITGEQQWQAAAWDMFTSIQLNTMTEFGNAALMDVSAVSPPKMDSMESFWMAETLKYFYLTFSEPNVISLDDYVFNTEAHPFKIPKPKA